MQDCISHHVEALTGGHFVFLVCAHYALCALAPLQQQFAPVALSTLQKVSAQLGGLAGNPAAQKLALGCVRLLCRIFFSLNALGVTPVGNLLLKMCALVLLGCAVHTTGACSGIVCRDRA